MSKALNLAEAFSIGGEKEARGVAIAVMLRGIMDIECYFVIGQMLLGARRVADCGRR